MTIISECSGCLLKFSTLLIEVSQQRMWIKNVCWLLYSWDFLTKWLHTCGTPKNWAMFSEALKLWSHEDSYLWGWGPSFSPSVSILGCVPCVGDISGKQGKVLGVSMVWYGQEKYNTLCCFSSFFFFLCFFPHISVQIQSKKNTPYCLKTSQTFELHSLFTLRNSFTPKARQIRWTGTYN